MHLRSSATSPGACPICGMRLEPVVPTVDEDSSREEYRDMLRRFWAACLSLVVLSIPAMFKFPALPEGTSAWGPN